LKGRVFRLWKGGTIMATKKLMCVLFGVLVISAWVLGSTIQARAETMKCKNIATATKDERIPVGDQEGNMKGYMIGLQVMEGLAFCENGEVPKVRHHAIWDFEPGKGSQAVGYSIFTFEDGSTVVIKFQRLTGLGQSGILPSTATSELIKGTGRFEGIKGTASTTSKTFLPSKGETARVFNDATWTYTLPSK
jgi:hypothetical protein